MLALTIAAVSAIRQLTTETARSDHSGLRITCAAVEEGTVELVASIATGPEPDDEVVETSGVRVYLDPRSVPLVKDLVLDAESDSAGQVRFALTPHTDGLPN